MRYKRPVVVFTIIFTLLIISLAVALVPRRAFQTVMPQATEQTSSVADPRIVIRKNARTLELFDGDRLVKKYEMALGFTPIGDKEVTGDGKTPEGEFYVFVKNDKSKFYLSLGVSYPGVEDARRGLKDALITRAEHDQIVDAIAKKRMPPQDTRLGGTIYIHGGVGQDWTWGCIAVVDTDMKQIYDAAVVGTPITILP